MLTSKNRQGKNPGPGEGGPGSPKPAEVGRRQKAGKRISAKAAALAEEKPTAPRVLSMEDLRSGIPLTLLLWRNHALGTREGTSCCFPERVSTPGHISLLTRFLHLSIDSTVLPRGNKRGKLPNVDTL